MKQIYLTSLLALMLTNTAYAHGDIHERIHALSHEIETTMQPIEQYVKRGQLYLDAEHPDDALNDFTQALHLAPKRLDIHYYSGQAHLALGNSTSAMDHANRFLQYASSNAARARALKLRGDIFFKQSLYSEAAIDYAQVIAQKGQAALPDDYVRVANTYLAADKVNAVLAVDWLTRGLQKLGPLVVLEESALQIETEAQLYDAALLRVERLIQQGQRLPFLLYKKGEILEKKGDTPLSKITYQQAMEKLNNDAQTHRHSLALQQLRDTLQAKLTLSE